MIIPEKDLAKFINEKYLIISHSFILMLIRDEGLFD